MTFDINKCKPFDLERALAGDKVVTRDGREVTEIHQFKTVSSMYEIYCVVNGVVYAVSQEGVYCYSKDGEVDKKDLFMAPKTKKFEAWVNVYIYGFACVTYNTKKEAEECTGEGHIKTIKIETEIEL